MMDTHISMFKNHLQIAIRCWSRDRARMVAEHCSKIRPEEMELFLAELLADALNNFNETYNKAYNEQVEYLERSLNEALNIKPIAPIFIRKP